MRAQRRTYTSSTHKKENQKDVGIFQHRNVFENRSVQDMQNCVNVTSLAPFQAAELLLNTPFLTISEQGATLKNDRKTWSFSDSERLRKNDRANQFLLQHSERYAINEICRACFS